MFDEEPDGDPHGECAAEIHRLQQLLGEFVEFLDPMRFSRASDDARSEALIVKANALLARATPT